jgi:hypothetical protein
MACTATKNGFSKNLTCAFDHKWFSRCISYMVGIKINTMRVYQQAKQT